jgi:hypothetical protein
MAALQCCLDLKSSLYRIVSVSMKKITQHLPPVPDFVDHFGWRKSEDFLVDLAFTPQPRFHGFAEPYTYYTLYKYLRLVSYMIRVL